jgi:hypothetical protein
MRHDVSDAIVMGTPVDIRSLSKWKPRPPCKEHELEIAAVIAKIGAVRAIEGMALALDTRRGEAARVEEAIRERAGRPDLFSPDETDALLERVLKRR